MSYEMKISARLGLSVVLAVALSACSYDKVNSGKNVTFDGERFSAKLTADKEDRAAFVVVVDEVSKTLAGAREAGRYQATRYCIANYGTSEVLWSASPDAPDGQLVIVDDTLTFKGSCVGW